MKPSKREKFTQDQALTKFNELEQRVKRMEANIQMLTQRFNMLDRKASLRLDVYGRNKK